MMKNKRNRSRLEIIAKILNVARDATRKTNIMYQANLSFRQTERYLNFLIEKGLLGLTTDEDGNLIYETTQKGVLFLKNFSEIERSLLGPR
ncbi:MAG: winged helix-turn-helix domain-containing protein [Candidatus Bathyarchaeia archaeon]